MSKTIMNYAKRKEYKIIYIYHEEDELALEMTKEEKKKYYNDMFNKLKN